MMNYKQYWVRILGICMVVVGCGVFYAISESEASMPTAEASMPSMSESAPAAEHSEKKPTDGKASVAKKDESKSYAQSIKITDQAKQASLERKAIVDPLAGINKPIGITTRPIEAFLVPLGDALRTLPLAPVSSTYPKRQPDIVLNPQVDLFLRGVQHRIDDLKTDLGKLVNKDLSYLGDPAKRKPQQIGKPDARKKGAFSKKALSSITNVIAKVMKATIGKASSPIKEFDKPFPLIPVDKEASFSQLFQGIRNLQQRVILLEQKLKNPASGAAADASSEQSVPVGPAPLEELYEPLPWVPMAVVFGEANIALGAAYAAFTFGAQALAGAAIVAAARKLTRHQRTIYLRSFQQEVAQLEKIAKEYLSKGSSDSSAGAPESVGDSTKKIIEDAQKAALGDSAPGAPAEPEPAMMVE
jgi:hypothetical protein